MKKKNIIFIITFFLLILNIGISKAENIAFIDLNRIFDTSEAGKKIIKQVKKNRK